MESVTISLRVEKRLHNEMKLHDEINWSAAIRKAILGQLEKMEHIDKERVNRAVEHIKQIRESGVFDHGRSSTEIIREWRDKRR